MKRWAAMMMSMILVLLSIGIAQSQTAMSGQSSSGGIRVAPRRPAAARRSMTGQAPGSSLHPGFARRPGFVNQPGFVHSGFVRNPAFARPSGFARSGRFPFWPGFATNRIFFVRGGVLAPWPYWYNYPPPSSTPSQYWAYCQDPEGYYPYVQDCPGGWIPVVPTPPAAEYEQQPTGATSTDDIREQLARSRAESNGFDVTLETAAGSRLSP
ncbi:MAG TPA: hypothetical protein VGA23_00415 [Methylomirabilota bacterium]